MVADKMIEIKSIKTIYDTNIHMSTITFRLLLILLLFSRFYIKESFRPFPSFNSPFFCT